MNHYEEIKQMTVAEMANCFKGGCPPAATKELCEENLECLNCWYNWLISEV